MIGKLIIFGIIAIAVIVVVPDLVKGNSHVPALETIKERIDYATTNHTQGNGINSIGYGGILANSSDSNTSKQPSNASNVIAGQNASTSLIPPQDVIKQTYTGQVFQNTNGTCQISVPGMKATINGQTELTHIIQVPNCNMTVNKPVQVTVITPKQNSTQSPSNGSTIQIVPYNNSNNDGSQSPSTPNTNPISSNNQNSDPPTPPYFQTVQLNAVNQGTSALLSYDDTTGQTTEVTVTMKNNEKILFSGTFYASQFHTEVNDVPNTPHIIEMTIQNAIYGTLHASAYAPPNIQNSTISGIFTN